MNICSAVEPCMMFDPYEYSPLNGPDHIRLLHIKPGTRDDSMNCEIHHVSLADSPVYEALSYTWDIDEPTEEPSEQYSITCGDFQISIGQNLFLALRRFRKHDEDLVIWADAICINQSDNQERGQQVGIMHRIYASCSRVLVWLGEEQPGDANAFDLIRRLELFSRTVPEEDSPGRSAFFLDAYETGDLPQWSAPEYPALAALLNRRWFHRVWVIQEAAMAPSALFYCGIHTIDLDQLLSLVLFLLETPEIFTNPALHILKQGPRMLIFIDQCRQYASENQQLNSTDLFTASLCFDATDPRDKFYGLLGLFQGQRFVIEPDYGLPPVKLFTDMSAINILEENSFASLSFADPSFSNRIKNEEDDGLPSWVPQWSNLSRRRYPFAFEGCYDSFNAATKAPEQTILYRAPEICKDRKILSVHGMEVDKIEILGRPEKYQDPLKADETNPANDLLLRIMDLLHWLEECGDIVKSVSPQARMNIGLESFWQTITLNGLGDAPLSPSEIISTETYVKDFGKYMRMMTSDPPIDADPALRKTLEDGTFTNLRFQQLIGLWRPRRVFGMTLKGYIGMFPEGAVKGDVVCVILGAKTPFVIRPEEGETYWFVGEAYVHGLMNGEVFDLPDFEELRKVIKLR